MVNPSEKRNQLQLLWLGISSYGDAIRMIFTRNLWHFFIPPLVLSLIILFGGLSLERRLENFEFTEAGTIHDLMQQMFLYIFFQSLVILSYEFRKYLVFIILSPMLTHLSYKTEVMITGNTYSSTFRQFISDIIRAIRIALGNFVTEYLLFTLWIILSTIFSSLKPLTPGIFFLIGCYFYGFSLIDYVNERRRLNITESVRFIRENAGFAFGCGLVFSALFFLPWDVGAIFAPVLGCVAAVIGVHLIVDLRTKTSETTKENSIENSTQGE